MALAVCLLFDTRAERAVRQLWRRLEANGIGTLLSHTHGLHVPHVSYAVLRDWDLDAVRTAASALPDEGPVQLHFDAMGLFRRNRSWLLPAGGARLSRRQERVVAAVEETGAELHKHYRPDVWIPHCTLSPRLRMDQLGLLAAAVYDVLPLEATADRAALVDSSTGRQVDLPVVP